MSKGTASGDLVGDLPEDVVRDHEEMQVAGDEVGHLRGDHEP